MNNSIIEYCHAQYICLHCGQGILQLRSQTLTSFYVSKYYTLRVVL